MRSRRQQARAGSRRLTQDRATDSHGIPAIACRFASCHHPPVLDVIAISVPALRRLRACSTAEGANCIAPRTFWLPSSRQIRGYSLLALAGFCSMAARFDDLTYSSRAWLGGRLHSGRLFADGSHWQAARAAAAPALFYTASMRLRDGTFDRLGRLRDRLRLVIRPKSTAWPCWT